MIDIRNYPKVIDDINYCLNHGSPAEVKNEKRRGEDNITVVELSRRLISKESISQKYGQ